MRVLFWAFPFLFGRAFIEARSGLIVQSSGLDFPSFSEGLSLRQVSLILTSHQPVADFPSFSEGLSLRLADGFEGGSCQDISLPFRKGFH